MNDSKIDAASKECRNLARTSDLTCLFTALKLAQEMHKNTNETDIWYEKSRPSCPLQIRTLRLNE